MSDQAVISDEYSKTADVLLQKVAEVIVAARPKACDGLPNHDRELVVAEGVRNIARVIANAELNCVENDPLYPYLVKTISVQRRVVLPGADTVYHSAVLHGDYTYRLFGNRGTAHLFELEVWKGHLGDLTNFKFHSSLDKFSIAPDGSIDVRIGKAAQKRTDEGDWIELPEGECTFLVRQYYYDLENEKPALLAIEREGAVYPPPPLDMKTLSAQMGRMADMIRTYPMAARHGVGQHLDGEMLEMHLAPVNIGFVKLRYLHGRYLCSPDEALILEVAPPKAKYWNFQLCNLQWEAIDYHQRQTSINGHQARLDSDGVFRLVISHQDPGVVNWLDTSGRTFGLISGRYYEPDEARIPRLKLVPFKDLDVHLPAESQRISQEERQQTIRRRMLSTIRRQAAD